MQTPVNSVVICAALIDKKELRYTPAGIAVFEATFHHCGEQFEAGALRRVEFDFPGLAFADIALRLSAVPVGQAIEMRGFFSTRSMKSSRLTLHITEFKD